MNELVKPSCCNPILLINKRALKCIEDGALASFPVPSGSPYSVEFARYLWTMFEKGWDMFVEYCGMLVPVFHYVPCGKCEICKESKRVDIIRRAELASCEYVPPPYQFKLTYDDAHLPQYSELQYRDVQLFFKRFRRRCERLHLPTDFKFIVAGEYGSKNTRRPHYHVIMFNNPFRCSEFEPQKEKVFKRLLWEAWRNESWFVFNQPENVTQCYGSMATYVTKYIGKASPEESVFIPQAGRYKHKCFVRCSSKLGRGVMEPALQEYRDGLACEFEYYSPQSGTAKKHHMSKSELRYLHPSPVQLLPSAVQTAYYSLVYSLAEAVRYGIMSKSCAINLSNNVKINVQHPRMLDFSKSCVKLHKAEWYNPVESVIQAITEDCAILADYGRLPQYVVEHYMRFRYGRNEYDGSEIAAKLFKIRKDKAVTFAKTAE